MRTDAAIPGEASLIITKCIAKGMPRDLEELITTHEGKGTSLISSKVNSGIKLVDELHIKRTIDSHELDQVKLLTQC